MTDIRRVYVEKEDGFNINSINLKDEVNKILKINTTNVKIINIYDIENLSEKEFLAAIVEVLSEPNVDKFFYSYKFKKNEKGFRVEYLPGQYDQRADSAKQCIMLLDSKLKPNIKASKLFVFENITDKELEKLKKYLINPVDSREVGLDIDKSLKTEKVKLKDVKIVDGFNDLDEEKLKLMIKELGLAMKVEDLELSKKYFKKEGRNPTITEIKVLDSYWSDHCRHTTFNTKLIDVDLTENNIKGLDESYRRYLEYKKELKTDKEDINLMDIATISAKKRKQEGKLDDLEISEEINACSITADVNVDGTNEKHLIMFKNETHNHPTEIEPFGGAATCLGGAIRDPLSGRSYVYQSMRISGSGDPRSPIEKTISGKLPQRSITLGAAQGFSSYGNQIGLNTGYVREYYNDDFIAKRMEVGFVIGSVKKENVVRKSPEEGDLILLLGGRTGRDGIGGATGSSKIHDKQSLEVSGAEVQKGNAPIERKIQRLFSNPTISKMIKKCNDCGAGGLSVAIGEIADSILLNLDLVPKKYEGLDGTEIAISESQERMVVVISPNNLDEFEKECYKENLEVASVAKVTGDNRFRMEWRNVEILNLCRDFINTSGTKSKESIKISPVSIKDYPYNKKLNYIESLKDINSASQRGLVERFDNSIGRNNVMSFYGGKNLTTPIQCMISKVPVEGKNTNTITIVSNGYNPKIAKWSPFHGGMYSVVESISKQIASGGKLNNIRFTFQEYFEKLGKDPVRWGKPFSALMGANSVMDYFELASIGGKDSMSGTYITKDNRIDVPPTLISFAVSVGNINSVITPEMKKSGNNIILFKADRNDDYTYKMDTLKTIYDEIQQLNKNKKILSSYVIEDGGVFPALVKMAVGNDIGFEILEDIDDDYYGSIVAEIPKDIDVKTGIIIGETIDEEVAIIGNSSYKLDDLLKEWEKPLEEVFPTIMDEKGEIEKIKIRDKKIFVKQSLKAKPNVFIPIFPGTNCEYDTEYKFVKAGGNVDTFVFRNLSSSDIDYSIEEMVKRIKKAQIITLVGGFSAGDEPEGSGKFIASVFKNPKMKDALMDLIENRDGLMLGICNGFQALIKLGLVQYGSIRTLEKTDPTLSFNKIGRHVSQMVYTKVVSKKSPWLAYSDPNKIYVTPVSHGEGRFVANNDMIKVLDENGQIAIQYVDKNGNPTYENKYNPNGSVYAVEALTSPDGRILGKMGHTERVGNGLAINVPDMEDLKLFKAGIDYFK